MDQDLIIEGVRRGVITPEEASGMMDSEAGPNIPGAIIHGGSHGASNLLGSLGEIQKTIAKVSPAVASSQARLPTGEDIRTLVGKITGKSLHQPQNPMEDYLSSGAQGAVSMMPFGGPMAALFGAGLGVAGEGASKAMPDNPELARAGTQLGIMGGANLLKPPARGPSGMAALLTQAGLAMGLHALGVPVVGFLTRGATQGLKNVGRNANETLTTGEGYNRIAKALMGIGAMQNDSSSSEPY